jgi:osmotically-inducible protein OsmY
VVGVVAHAFMAFTDVPSGPLRKFDWNENFESDKMKCNIGQPYLLAPALVLAMMSTGCTTVVFNAARLAKEDRTTASQFADTQIGVNVLSGLAEKDKNFLIDVNVDVWEARVLLTGTVSDNKTRQEIV